MKNRKKTIILFICVAFLAGIFCGCNNSTSVEFFTYNVKENGTVITGYNGKETEVKIPEEIDGNTVTEIDSAAFEDNGTVKSVSIPDGVRTIGNGSFSGCSELETVEIPSTVSTIGNGAFGGCTKLTTINVDDSNSSFYDESGVLFSVKKVLMCYPAGKKDKEYTVSDGTESVETNCFYGNGYIEKINLCDSVKTVSAGAFSNCNSLKNISVSDSNKAFTGINGLLYSKNKKTLVAAPSGISECKMVKTTEIIGECAFEGCTKLKNISAEKGLKKISDWAYSGCKELEKVVFAVGVEEIGRSVFLNCTSLKKIVFKTGLKKIGSFAFSGCELLTDVTLPETLTSVGASAFDGTLWLKTSSAAFVVTDSGVLLKCNKSGDVIVPDGVKYISSAFSNAENIISVVLPEGVKEIGENAFYGCKALRSVTIPESVKKINKSAFQKSGSPLIKGKKESCAETFAEENKMSFKEIK